MAAFRQRRLLDDQCPRAPRQTHSILARMSRGFVRKHVLRRTPRIHESPDSHHSRLCSQNVGHRFCNAFSLLLHFYPRPRPTLGDIFSARPSLHLAALTFLPLLLASLRSALRVIAVAEKRAAGEEK